jgi:hypothetical protein
MRPFVAFGEDRHIPEVATMIQPVHIPEVLPFTDIIFCAASELRRLSKMKKHWSLRVCEAGQDFLSVMHRNGALLYSRNSELWALQFWAASSDDHRVLQKLTRGGY